MQYHLVRFLIAPQPLGLCLAGTRGERVPGSWRCAEQMTGDTRRRKYDARLVAQQPMSWFLPPRACGASPEITRRAAELTAEGQ